MAHAGKGDWGLETDLKQRPAQSFTNRLSTSRSEGAHGTGTIRCVPETNPKSVCFCAGEGDLKKLARKFTAKDEAMARKFQFLNELNEDVADLTKSTGAFHSSTCLSVVHCFRINSQSLSQAAGASDQGIFWALCPFKRSSMRRSF